MMNSARQKQLAVARKKLGIEEADWRALLRDHGGVASSRDLDDAGFGWVMDRLRQLGFTSDHWQAGHGERMDRASPHQLRLIRQLWPLALDNPTEAHFRAWLEKMFKISDLRFASPQKAAGIITALKKMEARQRARNAGAASDTGLPPKGAQRGS